MRAHENLLQMQVDIMKGVAYKTTEEGLQNVFKAPERDSS